MIALRPSGATLAVAMTFLIAGLISPAQAADPKLDAANEQVAAAIANLESTDLPDTKGQRCRKQADKAVRQLKKAQATIAKAKACQDGTAPAEKSNRKGRRAR